MRYSVKNKLIGAGILSIAVLFFYGVYWIIEPADVKTRVGTIRYVEKHDGWWGLEVDRTFLGIPVSKDRLSFDEDIEYKLPDEFKQQGLRVKVRYYISDVIGMSDWDVYVNPIWIEKISE